MCASVPWGVARGGFTLKTHEYEGYVGVFDSGVGGISVLQALVDELPHENFVYFGDSKHAPYGEKRPEEVVDLSRTIVDELLGAGCKAIVIACNTATSAAGEYLRRRHPRIPIIGVEPALKPAVLANPGGTVLVMATPMTVRLEKFRRLMEEWGELAQVTTVPCEGLAARIEEGRLDDPDLTELVRDLVGMHENDVDAVVLGCTHYPFVLDHIRRVLGDVPFYDGGVGTARQLRRRLGACGLLTHSHEIGHVQFTSSKSTPAEINLYHEFFLRKVSIT